MCMWHCRKIENPERAVFYKVFLVDGGRLLHSDQLCEVTGERVDIKILENHHGVFFSKSGYHAFKSKESAIDWRHYEPDGDYQVWAIVGTPEYEGDQWGGNDAVLLSSFELLSRVR